MARNKKVEILSHDGQVLHPITDGDCVIFPDGETLTHKLSEDEAVMYTPEVVNSSPMFKVGEGDTSDYSSSVLDGAYQEAILKGQTYVNTIQEPSADEITLPTPFTEYERTQSKTFTEMNSGTFGINLVGQSYVNSIQEPSKENYVALGEALEFQNKKVEYTSNGQIKSAMLKGQTLVNLATLTTTKASGEITSAKSLINLNFNKSIFVPNKSYTIKTELKINSNTNTRIYYELFGRTSEGASVSVSRNIVTDDSMVGTIYVNKYIENILPLADAKKYSVDFYIAGRPIDTTLSCSYDIEVLSALFIEGDHTQEDIPYFEGMQSVTMSTELENVCSRYNSSLAKGGKTFTVGTWENRGLTLSTTDNISKYNFKPNTKYLVQFKVTNLNLDGLSSISIAFSDGEVSTGNSLFGDNAVVKVESNGIHRGILTTSNVISTSNFVIKGLKNQWENSNSTARKLTISQIMCIEYQNGMENWDLPYFETTQLMKPIKVQSVNKNLFDINDVPSTYNMTKVNLTNSSGAIKVTSTSDTGACYATLTNYANIKLKKGVNYRLSCNFTTSNSDANATLVDITNNNALNCPVNDSNGTVIRRTYCPTEDVTVCLRFYATTSSNGKNGGVTTYTNIQLEESSTATTYIQHQSKTTSALEPITLRAIGNIKDTLDLSTGEYVQRIGEIVLDGSDDEDWKMATNSDNANAYRFDTKIISGKIPLVGNGTLPNIVCDKYTTITFNHAYSGNAQGIAIFQNSHVVINNGMTALADFKASLASNPIKVQYELANPITRKISLEYPNLQTYQDITHVQSIAMDGTLIPNIYLPSDIVYKTLLKPNTKYNLQLKQNVVNADNPLTVNVGGTELAITQSRTLITTPSTLTSETVSFTGKGNDIGEVMLIENSTLLDGDIPYFDGIGDVHLGGTVENLCMANHTTVGGATSTDTLYSDKITSKITKTGSKVHIFQLTKNLENSKRYFIYCPYDYQYIIYGFRHEYNNSLLYTYQSCEGINKKYAIIKIDGNQQKNPYTHLAVGCHGNIPVDTTMTIRRPILCEYVDGMENWDWESIGYFTGTKNIGNEFMRIGNKNLFDGVLENGMINAQGVPVIGGLSKRTVNYIKVKSNTSYTLSCDNGYNQLYIHEYDKDYQNIIEKNIMTSNTFTTEQNTMYIKFNSHATNELQANTKIQLEKASSATSYVAHKHNALYIPQDESINLSFTQGGIFYNKGEAWTNATNNTNTARIRTQLFDLEPNETYRVSCGSEGYNFAVYSYDNSLVGTSDTSWLNGEYYINTTKNVHRIGIAVKRTDDANLTPSALHQVRLEKVTDVHLRSVGNVHDELDLTRGVYIQRIGEIVLDGSTDENWGLNSSYPLEGTLLCTTQIESMNGGDSNPYPIISCDKFSYVVKGYIYANQSISTYIKSIQLRVNNNIATTLEELKQYLQKNPITIQYILKTPIIHKIHIPMKNETNQTIAKPNDIFTLPLMYSEVNHIDLTPENVLPKVQSRDYIAYSVIASPRQQYTVFHNKVGSTDLTVNLCGASTTVNTHKNTITTPSSISQYELRLSGANNKVSNVCVFNGDCMNVNVPYVEGMMNAVNPNVKNIGRNLFDVNGKEVYSENNLHQIQNNEIIIENTIYGYYNCAIKYFNLKPSKTYNISYDSEVLSGNPFKKVLVMDEERNTLIDSVGAFTTPSNGKIQLKFYSGSSNNIGKIRYYNIQIEEASAPSQYEPYKENNCEPDYGEILSKNMFEQGSIYFSSGSTFTSMTSNTDGARVRTKQLLELEVGKTYVLKTHGSMYFTLSRFNNDEKGVNETGWTQSTTIIPTQDINKYGIAIKSNDLKLDAFNISDITLYELGKEIHLRSLPNGVRDELNLETGEYIQRIGEIVLNGSDDEGWRDLGFSTTNLSKGFYTDKVTQDKNSVIVNCDKIPLSNLDDIFGIKQGGSLNGIQIRITQKQISTLDLTNFKLWLQANPITVQYVLKTPIIKQVDIHNYPHSYKDGHVIIENGDPTTSVPAQLTYKAVTNRSGQIQEHTEQVEKQERQINELETLILENIRQNQNRSQNFLASLISTLEIEEE